MEFNLYLVFYSKFLASSWNFFFEEFAVPSDSVASDLGILGLNFFTFFFFFFFFICIARGLFGNGNCGNTITINKRYPRARGVIAHETGGSCNQHLGLDRTGRRKGNSSVCFSLASLRLTVPNRGTLLLLLCHSRWRDRYSQLLSYSLYFVWLWCGIYTTNFSGPEVSLVYCIMYLQTTYIQSVSYSMLFLVG